MIAFAGWGEFALAFALFLLTHMIPARPGLRARLIAGLGRGVYVAAYSAMSVALLLWLIGAAARAPYVELWGFAPWRMWAPVVAMAPACLVAALAVGAPNPLSFGGARDGDYDPARPGVVGVTRHPILAALALWAGAHLVPNGDLAHVILFGAFLAMALVGMSVIDRRNRRVMGEAGWRALLPRAWPHPADLSATRLIAGACVYAALMSTHPLFAGVSAIPPLP
ncbi:MAG: NnrU family protein [Rhizobiales bacterium]|nr:NnrU family protein [Hyphomicrobiales bacterium]